MAKRKAKTSKKKAAPEAEQVKRSEPAPNEGLLAQADQIAAWISKYTKPLPYYSSDFACGREIGKTQQDISHLDRLITNGVVPFYKRLKREKPDLSGRMVESLADLKERLERAKYSLMSASKDPSKIEIARERVRELLDGFGLLIEDLWYMRKELKGGIKAARKRAKLGPTASLIYEKLLTLPEHRAMPLPDIVQWLWDEHQINLTDSTVHQKHLKQLEPWGLQHDPRIGYSINRDKKV